MRRKILTTSEREPQIEVERVVSGRIPSRRIVIRARAIELLIGEVLRSDARVLPRIEGELAQQSRGIRAARPAARDRGRREDDGVRPATR